MSAGKAWRRSGLLRPRRKDDPGFLRDTARDAAKHLAKGSHTNTRTREETNQGIIQFKIPTVTKFSSPGQGRNEWKDGMARCCRSARLRSGGCRAAPSQWDALGPNPPKVCALGARNPRSFKNQRRKPIPAPAPAASCTATSFQNLDRSSCARKPVGATAPAQKL